MDAPPIGLIMLPYQVPGTDLFHPAGECTVRKMDLILRPIELRPQMQFSMARRFKLQLLSRYSVKFSKMRNFTLGMP